MKVYFYSSLYILFIFIYFYSSLYIFIHLYIFFYFFLFIIYNMVEKAEDFEDFDDDEPGYMYKRKVVNFFFYKSYKVIKSTEEINEWDFVETMNKIR